MSASTVSITANPTTSRRRPVITTDMKSGLDLLGTDASPISGGVEMGPTRDSSQSIERSRREAVVQVKKSIAPNSGTSSKPYRSHRKAVSKPKWQTVVSVLTKNLVLLLLLAGVVQIIRRVYFNSVVDEVFGSVGFSDNVDGKIAEVEGFVKRSVKMMQVQVEVLDRKVKEVEDKSVEIRGELGKLGGKVDVVSDRMGSLERYLNGNEWLSKGEFDRFFEEFKGRGGGDGSEGLDEVMAVAREMVGKEIEKHAADGLGRVDYALGSGGGFVVKHSEAYVTGGKGGFLGSGIGKSGVHANSGKMLRPSFGEPGDCFALKGSSGFVQIKLRTEIVPEAVTLEHVAKSVAYDRSSAPKDCRVSGWFRGHETTDLTRNAEKMLSLAEFTYDLEKSNAQTFDVSDSSDIGVIDMIRLDFTSNHGSASHTCIYRFRVHGHEPDTVVPLAIQS
ncbi:SUN domain-containing protein 2-like [Apium graveolens]|uniref:SUN domain-containing protein 2-like n=1 Tax=Apium graveolens TaxID=4045 RepID=UPI003D7A3F8A